MANGRISDLRDFYVPIDALAKRGGGPRVLASCSGRLNWPERGVYFFMERGENRSDSGDGPRIVRVGPHALKEGSKTSLWTRLSQHRGQQRTGGGNHRGSIFRLIVGEALIARSDYRVSTWGKGNNAPSNVRQNEFTLECEVSKVIGAMPFVWIAVDDEPGADSLRGHVERNAAALLSNFDKEPLDPPSAEWLGHSCDRERVRRSGLWNSNHVDERYDPAFLAGMERLVRCTERIA